MTSNGKGVLIKLGGWEMAHVVLQTHTASKIKASPNSEILLEECGAVD